MDTSAIKRCERWRRTTTVSYSVNASMDSGIISAAIGGAATVTATIGAVVIGWWLNEKKGQKKRLQPAKSPDAAAIESRPQTRTSPKEVDTKAKQRLTSRQADNLSPLTVKEIVESINSSPPFQKDKLSKQYNGITVRWVGYLKEASEDFRDSESVRVNLTIEPDAAIGNSFWFTEKVSKFPQIRTLKKGSRIAVTGEITSASGGGLCVVLRPLAIEVIQHA